jgi:hypothetical protein
MIHHREPEEILLVCLFLVENLVWVLGFHSNVRVGSDYGALGLSSTAVSGRAKRLLFGGTIMACRRSAIVGL